MTIFGTLANISFGVAWIATYPLAFTLGALIALIYARKKIREAKCPHCKGSLEKL